MLIAHVITRLLRAGAEENTLATCLAQAAAGHEVMLIHGRDWSRAHEQRHGSAVQMIEIKDLVPEINPVKDFAATRKMRALFQERRPTIVHTHQSKAGIVGRVAARWANVPLIIHGVHILPFVNVGLGKKAVYLTAERAVARFTNAFISVSEGTRRSCLEHSVGSPEQHFVAHSGIDLARFRSSELPPDWRAVAGVAEAEEKPPIVLMLAALEPRKRHVPFLAAFRRVVDRVPNVRLLIAGDGAMRGAINAAIASKALSANVRLLGFHSHPEQLVALADLTVLTSVREGLPRVLVQSLAGGKPVVTTALPGIDEVVKNGVNGVVTGTDNLGAAADAVADLLTDRTRLAQMQTHAARTDVASWDVDTMCRTISGIYEQLLHREDHARDALSRTPLV